MESNLPSERTRKLRKLILVVAAFACLVPVAAFAAKPAKNSAFQYCPKKDSCPLGFETNKAGTKIVELRMYNDCSRVPVTWPSIKVGKDGKFSKSGKVKNVVNQQITYSIAGRFVKPGKAVGTFELDAKGCNKKPEKFTAKRMGKAQPGI